MGRRSRCPATAVLPWRTAHDPLEGRRLNLPVVAKSPEEAAGHFGFLGHFLGLDVPASSVKTQEWLGWRPPGLIPDLDHARYFET
jgi:hypothetical protein